MIKQKIYTSLRVKLLFTMLVALAVGVGAFILIHFGIDRIINKQYMSNEAVEERTKSYIHNLQNYIEKNELSSKDTTDITRWVKNQRYVYLVIYKDNELIFDSSIDYEPKNTPTPTATLGSDSKSTPGITPTPTITPTPNGANTVNNEKPDISQYLDKDAELFPIKLSDGTMFASISESTQEFYYNLSYIIAITAAFFLFAIIIMIYFNQTTIRIERLAKNVRKIEQDNNLPDLISDGSDEIAELANDVNKMKNSIFEKMQKEQDAWNANTELITAMSHDIRNPLTVLLGYLDVMEMQEGASSSLSSYISACKETALKIKDLSDGMFQYFLVFGKKDIDMTIQEYDAQTLLNQVLAEHILLMSENGYTFVSETLDKKCTILIDASSFVRVIDNLFSNLKKYADINKPIYINTSADDNTVTLIMKNSIIQNDVESNGIGLKTCAKIMDAMNARFNIENDDETFTVTLEILIKKD